MLYLKPGLNIEYILLSLALTVDKVSDPAAQLVLFLFVDVDPLVAGLALHQALLALPLVRLHLRLGRVEVAVWKPALDDAAHRLYGLLCYQAASPVILG